FYLSTRKRLSQSPAIIPVEDHEAGVTWDTKSKGHGRREVFFLLHQKESFTAYKCGEKIPYRRRWGHPLGRASRESKHEESTFIFQHT
ncbi:unnamed protein product, partial [Amoebophrya sp. A25]